MAIIGRDRRAAAQAMLWSPLHPDPDGAPLSVSDRKIVVGVYPKWIVTVVIGLAAGNRRRVQDYRPDGPPRLVGRYYPAIDE